MRSVLVVGAGAAGLAAVESLRHEGYDGQLTLVGDEPCLPYDRPPLSKQVLAGTWPIERTALRDAAHFASLGVQLVQGRRAIELDLSDRNIVLDSGERLPFDGLVIATGVTPRRLPSGHELSGVHVLRSQRDVNALRSAFANRPRLVVVGAGFLGSEVAATARALGLDVVLVDPQPQPMHGQLGEHIGARVAELHRANGVQVRTGVGVAGLVGASGLVTGVELSDGSLEPAEVVLVAIGSTPNIDWLEGSGLSLGDGVLCDEYCGAGEGVYAAGDIASWFHLGYGRQMRLEHRMNATEQGTAAAANLLNGASQPFVPIPYFWTDHYDTKIQVHGVIPPGAAPVVVEGNLSAERFTVLYQDSGGVHALLTWNNPKSARHYRQELSVVKHATASTGDNHDRSHTLAPR